MADKTDKTDKDQALPPGSAPGALRRARLAERAAAAVGSDDDVTREFPFPALDRDDDGEIIDDEDLPDKLYFRIGEVSQLVGVDTHVLRYWESEFKMKPHRSSSGQRLYRKQDLSRFLRIKTLLHEEGYTIAGARKAMSGSNGGPTIDPAMLADALQRLESLRSRIANLRREIEPKHG